MAQGPKGNLCSGLGLLEFSIKAHWKFLSVLVLPLSLAGLGFISVQELNKRHQRGKREDNSSPGPVDTDICGF